MEEHILGAVSRGEGEEARVGLAQAGVGDRAEAGGRGDGILGL